MAVILNNPMPTTGALYVTNPVNPQGKFYKWLGRNYTIQGSRLVKRKRALSQASGEGRKYDKKDVWSKYKRIYDALSASSTTRKSIIKLYRKDKPQRIRQDRIGRKKMMEIFSEVSDGKRRKSKKRKSSSKKSATKSRSKLSATERKSLAEKYKRSRSKKRYTNLVKKYGMKDASAIVKLAKSSKSSTSTSKRGKSMAKRKLTDWQKAVKKYGGVMQAKKHYKKPRKKSRKNPVIKSKPIAARYQNIGYQNNEIGRKLARLAKGALQNLPLYASKADVRKYLSKVDVPSGYLSVMTEDLHAALDNTKKPQMSRTGGPNAFPSGQFGLRMLAQAVVKDLGYLDPSDADDKKAIDSYFRKIKYLRGKKKGDVKQLYIDLMQKYEQPPTQQEINATVKLYDESSVNYPKAALKKRRRKASAKRKSPAKRRSSSKRKKSSKRKAPKGAWLRTVKKYGGNMKKARAAYRKQYKLRRNPAMALGSDASLAGKLLKAFDYLEKGAEQMPIVKHIAPVVNIAGLSAGAALIHWQVQSRAGQYLASQYAKVPVLGKYLLKAPSTSNGAAVWLALSGLAYAQPKLPIVKDLPEVIDQTSANVIGTAALLTGVFLDSWTYLSKGGSVPFFSKLPYVGQYFGEGGQYFLGQMGAISMSGAHDLGAVGMHHNPLHVGAVNFNGGLGMAKELVSDKVDACHCPSDLAPIEVKAAIAKKMDSFGPLPKKRTHKRGTPSPAAGKLGHQWNWLREMIGDDNFAKLAKLNPTKRKQVIALMKQEAAPQIIGRKPVGSIGMGAYSALEMGSLAMSGMHDTEDISGLVAPMAGASNAPGGVGGFGGLLYAGE